MSNLILPSKRPIAYPGGYDGLVMPAGTYTQNPRSKKRGMDELVSFRELGIVPGISGGAPVHGIHQVSDVLTQLADGTDLNQVWLDFMELLNSVNASRQAIINFLTYEVTNPTDTVAQNGDGVDFEEATELGEPVGSRVQPTYFQLGYGFKWYDLASRYSWQYLAEATQTMVDSVANAAVEAYYRLLMVKLLANLFASTNVTTTIKGNNYTVYRFYNADGTVPPSYKTNTFTGSHTHYVRSGAATVDSGDLDEIANDFDAHGYTQELGYTRMVLVNKAEGDVIRTFKAVQNGGTAKWDFLPATNQPGTFVNQTQIVMGQGPPAGSLRGLTVIGSYGTLLIVQDDWFPAGYIVGVATGGENNLTNPMGIRQHANANLRGLRLVRGKIPDYPLIDSFWAAGFGFGTRQRGSVYVMQIATAGSYAPPAAYTL
jgi:hypothetical protein